MRGKFFHFANKKYIFIKMEKNKFFCFKLKLKADKLIACASKEDLIELIRQSEDCQVEPIHSTLIEMARRKKSKTIQYSQNTS